MCPALAEPPPAPACSRHSKSSSHPAWCSSAAQPCSTACQSSSSGLRRCRCSARTHPATSPGPDCSHPRSTQTCRRWLHSPPVIRERWGTPLSPIRLYSQDTSTSSAPRPAAPSAVSTLRRRWIGNSRDNAPPPQTHAAADSKPPPWPHCQSPAWLRRPSTSPSSTSRRCRSSSTGPDSSHPPTRRSPECPRTPAKPRPPPPAGSPCSTQSPQSLRPRRCTTGWPWSQSGSTWCRRRSNAKCPRRNRNPSHRSGRRSRPAPRR